MGLQAYLGPCVQPKRELGYVLIVRSVVRLVCRYMASDFASFFNGANLMIDGGYSSTA